MTKLMKLALADRVDGVDTQAKREQAVRAGPGGPGDQDDHVVDE